MYVLLQKGTCFGSSRYFFRISSSSSSKSWSPWLLQGAPGGGPPKETQPFWESIQVILMKLLLSWVSEVSTVWSPTKTLAGWCLVMSSREQVETIFSTKWFEQRFCNNSGWFVPTSKETESVESNVSRSTLQLFNKNHGTATAEGD